MLEGNNSEIEDLEVAKKMIKISQSAYDRRLEYNLSFLTVKRLLSYSTCYYTNKPFEDDGQYARSFDRVDSAKGYIEGNVVACTVDINGKKSNLTAEEITCLYMKLVSTEVIKNPVRFIPNTPEKKAKRIKKNMITDENQEIQ